MRQCSKKVAFSSRIASHNALLVIFRQSWSWGSVWRFFGFYLNAQRMSVCQPLCNVGINVLKSHGKQQTSKNVRTKCKSGLRNTPNFWISKVPSHCTKMRKTNFIIYVSTNLNKRWISEETGCCELWHFGYQVIPRAAFPNRISPKRIHGSTESSTT
jgi:hypothetical protein